jgi:hypothetical protein
MIGAVGDIGVARGARDAVGQVATTQLELMRRERL